MPTIDPTRTNTSPLMPAAPLSIPSKEAGFPARGRWLIDSLALDLGLTEVQAAGIVGNIGFESRGLTVLHEIGQPDGVGGYGWAQWTASRRTEFLAWARSEGLEWSSDAANYGFLIHELGVGGSQEWVLQHLKECSVLDGPNGSVFTFGRYFEAPGGTTSTALPGYDDRLIYARRALTAQVQGQPNPPLSADASLIIDAFEKGVRDLQVMLSTRGYYTGRVDGDYGPQTRAALQRLKAEQSSV